MVHNFEGRRGRAAAHLLDPMSLVDHITATLTPELGAHSADAVARHLCAKYGISDSERVDPEKLEQLRDFLRRGLVAYVGTDRADALARAAIAAG
jgi:hypothetical protein